MSISRGWGLGLVTASWLNRRVMNGPGAWLWNGLQLLPLLVDDRHSAASMSKHTICCIKKCKKKKESERKKAPQPASVDDSSNKKKKEEPWFSVWNHCSLTEHWRLLLLDLLLLSKSHLRVLWKITFFPPICMFLHRSTSQSNLPGYHNSHSVSRPQHPPSR